MNRLNVVLRRLRRIYAAGVHPSDRTGASQLSGQAPPAHQNNQIILACLLAIIGWGIGFRRDGRRALLILKPSADNLAVPAFLALTLIVFAMN